MMTIQFCDQCGSPNRLQARFCWQCGQPLQQPATSSLATGSSREKPAIFPRQPIRWIETHVSNRFAKESTIAVAHAIIREGLMQLEAGANLFQMRKGLEEGSRRSARAITLASRPIKSREEIVQVVTTTVGDQQVGALLAEAMDRVGQDGTISVEAGRAVKTRVEYVQGMRLEQGYLSAYFVTNTEQMEASIDEPYILITNKKISTVADLLPILEKLTQQGKRDMVIIAEDVDGEALAMLVVNKLKNILNVLAVGIADLPERRKMELLGDIAILTGGQVLSETQGRRLANATLADLGRARQVVAQVHETLIMDPRGEPSAIQQRLRQIKTVVDKTTDSAERGVLMQRLAKLTAGVAVIRAGGSTETELMERKQHFEDGLALALAAREEGVVAGGGAGLLTALPALDEVPGGASEMQVGIRVLRRALEEPLRRNARKVGRKGEEVVAELVMQPGYGIDRQTGEYVNMFAVGCIEPVRIVRLAVLRAVETALEFFELNAQEE